MYYTKIETKFGEIFLLSDGQYLLALDFEITTRYKNAELKNNLEIFKETKKQLNEYASGNRQDFDLALKPEGTDFQQLAWKTLVKIPYGKVLSYGEQASKMKKPNAQRATGSANGKNPLPIIIPCHRIITADGKLGGYSGDIKLKERLLKIEGHQVIDGRVK